MVWEYGGALALWKIGQDLITSRSKTQEKNIASLIDYIEAARLCTSAIALEGQQIVGLAMAITPASTDDALQALRDRTTTHLLADKYREGLERALKGIAEYTGYLTEKNQTVSTWPFGGTAAEREKILMDVTDLMNDLKTFLDNLVHDGSLVPGTGLQFLLEMAPVIQDGNRLAIHDAALTAVQHPSYSMWREHMIRSEEVVSTLKLKFR